MFACCQLRRDGASYIAQRQTHNLLPSRVRLLSRCRVARLVRRLRDSSKRLSSAHAKSGSSHDDVVLPPARQVELEQRVGVLQSGLSTRRRDQIREQLSEQRLQDVVCCQL